GSPGRRPFRIAFDIGKRLLTRLVDGKLSAHESLSLLAIERLHRVEISVRMAVSAHRSDLGARHSNDRCAASDHSRHTYSNGSASNAGVRLVVFRCHSRLTFLTIPNKQLRNERGI